MGSVVIPLTLWISDYVNSLPMPTTRAERDKYLLTYAFVEPIQEILFAEVIQMLMGVFVFVGIIAF